MTLTRRTLLVGSSRAAVLALVPAAAIPVASSLRTYRLQDSPQSASQVAVSQVVSQVKSTTAAARFQAGQTLIVDSATQSFTGDGLYLYPAWGSPRPYWVTAGRTGSLQFHDPISGMLFWEQNSVAGSHFAAAVVAELAADTNLPVPVPALQVPRLPA